MAKKSYNLEIDSYVGDWNCNNRIVKQALAKSEEIIVLVNSLGGDVNTAINIATQFEYHGNVRCELVSFNASAATLLTLGAKTVAMHENSMYLIHKAMMWVDEFGYMNEDNIEELINKLKTKQENAAVVTATIAQMYAKKTDKPIQDILNLMKEEKWLNAETAKEWGFIDEIFGGSVSKQKKSNVVDMLNKAELPLPEGFENIQETDETEEDSNESFFKKFINYCRNEFSNSHKDEKMMNMTKITAVFLAALFSRDIEAVENKVEFTKEEIDQIENAFSEKDTKITNLESSVSEKDTEIANLKNQIENLKKAPGDTTNGAGKDKDDILDDEENDKTFDNSIVESARNLYNSL